MDVIQTRELPEAPQPALLQPPPEGWPVVSERAHQQKHYELLRAQGQSHNFAEMIALAQFPATVEKGLMGNDNFHRGRYGHKQLDEMPAPVRQRYLDAAKEAGVSIAGKVYSSTLARFNCDPLAWVSDAAEMKARCDEEGWSMDDADGNVLHKPKELKDPSWITQAKKQAAARARRKKRKAVKNGR